MEHYDETNTGQNNGANNSAGNGSTPPMSPDSGDEVMPCATANPQPWPNTAIERQMEKVNHRKQTYRLPPDRPARPRAHRPNHERKIFRPIVLTGLVILLLFIAGGMAFVVTDRDHLVQNAVAQFIQNNFWDGPRQTAPSTNTSLPSSLPAAETSKAISASSSAALSIPLTDISLQNRPEFLTQLVQVYRTQLADNPNDPLALSALAQLQERSLAELQTIIAGGDEAAATKSMGTAVKIFPELSNNTRYMYLASRMDYIQHQQKAELTKAELSNPSNSTATTDAPAAPTETPVTTAAATTSVANASSPSGAADVTKPLAEAPAVANPKPAAATAQPTVASTAASTKITTPPPKSTASETPESSAKVASTNAAPTKGASIKESSVTAASLKPEIRSVSVTPGTMADGEFIPGEEGHVFLVEIAYRNFDKAFGDKPEATLVTRLGVPGDSMVLAEVPVVVTADRGTTSFIAETYVQSSRGGKFTLNFLLNDEFLTSRTLRISLPRRSAAEN